MREKKRNGAGRVRAAWQLGGLARPCTFSLALPGKKTSKQKTSKQKKTACLNLPEPA